MRALLWTLGLMVSAGCGRGTPQPPADQPQHPLLRTLTAPPLNLPVKAAPILNERARLPPGDEATLLLLKEGRPFHGSVSASGRLTARAGSLELSSQDKRSTQILYRLPPGLPPPPEVEANGDVSIVERPSAAGLNRQIVARRDGLLVFAHVFLRSSKPVTVALADGLRLSQGAVPLSTPRPILMSMQVGAFEEERMIGAIPVGKPTQIRTRAGTLQAFVETSHLAYLSGRSDQQDGRYVLQAWVVQSQK